MPAHVCNDDCHRPGGPLEVDAHGNSIVSEIPPDPLVIADSTGRVIFRLADDGTAYLPDPADAKGAAAIFWREVLTMARLMRIPLGVVGVDR